MSGGLPAVVELGPRLAGIYRLLEICSDEIEGCEMCNLQTECEWFCEENLYNCGELSPKKFDSHMSTVLARQSRRKKIAAGSCRPVCVLSVPVLRRRAPRPLILCGSR